MEKTQPDGPPDFYPLPAEASNAGRVSGQPGELIRRAPRPPVTVLLQPEEKTIGLHKVKTARAVLTALGLRECTALVARDGELLTPDRAVAPGDALLVRKVTSSG